MYQPYSTSTNSDVMATKILAGVGAGTIIFSLLIIVFMLICMWKIFVKAGEEGWKAIIPIYNTIVLLKILKMEWWHILIMLFVPFAYGIYMIIFQFRLAKVFGKGVGFGFLLLFVSIIGYPLLAFGDSKYEG